MRDRQVDEAIEKQFGKPDFSKTFQDKYGNWLTPLKGKYKIWRVDNEKPPQAKTAGEILDGFGDTTYGCYV